MSDQGGADDVISPTTTSQAASDGEGSVTLVGTAHVSAESADRVTETIDTEQPDVVAVELDEARYRQFKGETPDDLDPSDLLGGNTVFQFIAYWMLSYVQSRLGERFGIEPGADMKAAIEAAETGGHKLALVDRNIQTTMQRFWARLSVIEKLKLVGGLGIGASDPRTIGLAVGVVIGLFGGLMTALVVGPLLGIGELFTLGAGAATTSIIGGLGLGAIGGLFIAVGLLPSGRFIEKGVGGIVLGATAGTWLAITGTALPIVGSLPFTAVGETILRGTIGAGGGLVVGGLVGIGLGSLFAAGMDERDELTESDIEALTDGDVVTAMMEEFRQFSPGGAEALIDERDAYIAHQLLALRAAGHDVVAVVGAGHRAGIQSYLDAPSTLPPIDSITGTDSGRRFSLFKLFGYAVMVGFIAFFVLLAMAGVQNTLLLQVFAAWFLFNGVFAFTAARLAGGTLPSAGVGGAIAWLTSINPLLAPGWFAGYVELRYRPVNVTDISRLNELLEDHQRPLGAVLKDMYDVPLFRLIAVVAMTNIGSLVATLLFPFVVLPFFFEGITGVSQIGEMMIEGATNSAEWLRDLLAGIL